MITLSFYQEAYSTNLIPFLSERQTNTIKIENRFGHHQKDNYAQLKQNVQKNNFDIKFFLNENTLKQKMKSRNDFRLWNGILLKYSSSFCYHIV